MYSSQLSIQTLWFSIFFRSDLKTSNTVTHLVSDHKTNTVGFG